MKKLLITVFVLASFLAQYAQAKTEGSYVGVDLLRTDAKSYESYSVVGMSNAERVRPSFDDHGYGVGLNYKYAVNLNKFFIAPAVIIEANNTKIKGSGGRDLSINKRYGIKADFGYDVTDIIAPYFTVGYSKTYYSTTNGFSDNDGSFATSTRSANVGDWFYGLGLKADCSPNTSLNFEFNTQNFSAKTRLVSAADVYNYAGVYKTRMDVFKVGMSYKF